MIRLGAPVIVITAVASFAALFWLAPAPGDDPPAEGGPGPHLTVYMNQSIKRMEFEGLSPDKQASFFPHGDLLDPCRLTVVTTDGTRLGVGLRSVSVSTGPHRRAFDAVTDVYARRPLKPGKFQEAVADLLATIRGWGIEPDADLLELTKWGNPAGHESRGIVLPINAGGMPLSDLLDLEVKFYPDPDRGWFYLMTFAVPLELRPGHIQLQKEKAIHHRAIESIRSVLAVPVQIEELFPLAAHRFNNFVFKDSDSDFRKTWSTEAWCSDRYFLTMKVPVELDRKDKTVTSLRGEPTFVLQEVDVLAPAPNTGGRLDPVWRREHRFDLAAWNKLVAAGGDFSAIGIEIDPTPVAQSGDFLRRWRNHNQEVRLLRDVRERAVTSAVKFLPAAIQIERMFSTSDKKQVFPSTDHFFSTYEFNGKDSVLRKTFVTEAYFGGRYQLTMQADVELDRNDKVITRLRSQPTFVLRELESVEMPDGFYHRDVPRWRREDRFDLEAWNKVVAADGDFSVIGITIDTTPQSKSEAERARSYVHSQRSFRDRVSLLDAAAGDGDEPAKKLPEPEVR
jgi:hypothetical protein